MSLMRRSRPDLERPDLFMHRFFDWPVTWTDLFEDTDMRVEEFQDDNELVVRAEMAGLDPDKDLDISVADGRLTIKAERRQESEVEEKTGYRSEIRYGSFMRTVPLPSGATEDDVKATYTDGILEVRVPLDSERAEPKRIPVTRH